jgi:hypothetical protein
MRFVTIVAALAAALFCVSLPAAAAGYGDWAGIVVAGDFHAHSGAESEVFDNARRDVAADLMEIGFSSNNVIQFSIRPERYPAQQPRKSDPQTIATALWDLSNGTSGGCFAYFTSHGTPDGFVIGEDVLLPGKMSQIVNNACGDRPTVVFVSSCFSGVFVPVLAAPNRLVMSAARPDRTSFGCGESNRYTFFDTCFLENFKGAGDFPTLAKDVDACVSAREKKDGIKYPSEPQISIGASVAAQLPHWK